MKSLRVLIACEKSGTVRRAFRALGHDAWSCDLHPADDGSPHHAQCDVLGVINGQPWETNDGEVSPAKWDLVIAHPPCTYLCNSGVLRLYNDGKKANGLDLDRWAKMRDGAYLFDCFRRFYDGPLCIENPVMHGHAFDLLSESTQMLDRQSVQPWQFGDDASKRTVLWLRALPRLIVDPSKFTSPRIVNGRKRWANQTDSGQNKLAPSPTRAAERAVTYAGIAKAMAEQWSAYLCK